MMRHKGYVGECWVDPDARVIRGRVVGIKDVITFQAQTIEKARAASAESVEDYLDFCAERGERPEAPYSGRDLYRTRHED